MIRQASLTTCLAVALVAACGDSMSDGAPGYTRERADSAIYAILLDSLRGSGDSVMVLREYDTLRDSAAEVRALAAWAEKELPALDSGLVVALANARSAGSVRVTLGDAHGVLWVRDYQEVGERSQIAEHRTLSFTRVAYDTTGKHAVVYASMGCGPLCGHGSFYAFELREGTWRMVGAVVRVMS